MMNKKFYFLLMGKRFFAEKNPRSFSKEFCFVKKKISNELAHGNTRVAREKNVMDRSKTTGRERI